MKKFAAFLFFLCGAFLAQAQPEVYVKNLPDHIVKGEGLIPLEGKADMKKVIANLKVVIRNFDYQYYGGTVHRDRQGWRTYFTANYDTSYEVLSAPDAAERKLQLMKVNDSYKVDLSKYSFPVEIVVSTTSGTVVERKRFDKQDKSATQIYSFEHLPKGEYAVAVNGAFRHTSGVFSNRASAGIMSK